MAQSAPVQDKIPTKNPQPSRAGATRPAAAAARPGRVGRSAFAAWTGRAATRGDGRVVVEVEGGITVYPARRAGDRWRAVWYEGGRRRQCEAVAEDKLAVKLARVAERLAADAPGLERPGADLIAWYLSPDRHPAGRPWSRKHADTQRRLCERFVAPVIAAVCCQDIRLADTQRIVNAAPTAGEGARLRRCLSALVTAGIAAGYLTSPRLKEVHWQAAGRAAPGPQVAIAGEPALFVDPAEIPADHDVARLGRALASGRRGDLHELMAATAAYAGLRQGELFALTAAQVAPAARVITVDRKVVEVAGKLYLEAPKGRKRRSTIYPARTPAGYPLADRLAARMEEALAEQAAGTNPLGLMFPSPRGTWWRSSNFDRRVLAPAYQAAGWRGPGGDGTWTWHSLRHVFCTTALSRWHLEPADVSCMAGHATVRVTLDMYIGATAGVLDRARTATR
jgi:integrase